MSLTRTPRFNGDSRESPSWKGELQGVFEQLKHLIPDERGLAAIEFAIIAPFLIVLYLGIAQVLQEIIVNRQVSITATTVANLVSQYTTISQSTQLPDILNAATQVMAPYSAANATVVVTVITMDNGGNATVKWSQALNGAAQTAGANVTVPAALDMPATTLILSQVTYAYTPAVDFLHLGTSNLHASLYMVPRESSTINLVP